jgi:transcriptional regulator with XRE-family HTH domain
MKKFSFPDYCRTQQLGYEQLAELLGISRSYACQIRLGRKPLSMTMLKRVHIKLGVPLESLLQ